MAKESFLLVDLKEDQAKKLANVISNDSCRKILDFLADKENATESEVSETLEIPLSTVHYNLDLLTKSGLVVVEEFHYSEKGKEVNHYKLANKYIIIAPSKKTPGILERIKDILPLGIFGALATGALAFFGRGSERSINEAAMPAVSFAADQGIGAGASDMVLRSGDIALEEAKVAMMQKSVEFAGEGGIMSFDPTVNTTFNATNTTFDPSVVGMNTTQLFDGATGSNLPVQTAVQEPNIILWFGLGVLSVLIFFLIYKLLLVRLFSKDKGKKGHGLIRI